MKTSHAISSVISIGKVSLIAAILAACSPAATTPAARTASPDIPPVTASPTPVSAFTLIPIPLVWEPVNDGAAFERDEVTALAADPQAPDNLYAATLYNGLFKTTDGGSSWRPAGQGLLGQTVRSLAVDRDQPSTVLAGTAGTYDGIYRSTDAAGTWTKVLDHAFELFKDPKVDGHSYAYGWNGLYETRDGGQNWTLTHDSRSEPGNFQNLAIDPTDGQTLFGTKIDSSDGLPTGLYVSHDGGRTWVLFNAEAGNGAVAIARQADGSPVYFINKQIQLSVVNADGTILRTFDHPGAFCPYSLVVDPYHLSTVYCLTWEGYLFRTLDAGVSLQQITSLKLHILSLVIDRVGGKTRLIAGGQGVRISTDGGLSWTKRDTGLGMAYSELVPDPQVPGRLFLSTYYGDAGYSCSIYRSDDGGASWSPGAFGLRSIWCGPAFGPDGQIYKLGDNTILRSQDGGNSWTPVRVPDDPLWVAANPHIPGQLFAAARGSLPQLSNDDGQTWQPLPANVTDTLDDQGWNGRLYFSDPDGRTIYFTSGGRAFGSSDAGQSWWTCGKLKYKAIAIDPRDPTHLFAATDGQGLLASQDGCRTWAETGAGLSDLSVYTLAIDPNRPDTLYAGTRTGAYLSSDGGKSWQALNAGLPDSGPVYSIAIDSQGKVLATTAYGIFQLESK